MQPSQPLRAASGVHAQDGNSSVISRVRQSSVTVICALVAPSIGVMLARMFVSSDGPWCVNDENNSPFVPMAMERNVAAVSETICLFSVRFQPQCGAQLRTNVTSGVPLGLLVSGGSARANVAPAGALKSSTVLKVIFWAVPKSNCTSAGTLALRFSKFTPAPPPG